MIVLSDFKEPDSVIRHQENNTKAVMDHKELGTGTLFITESLLSWQGEGPQGFSIPYFNISMHAISKDATLYPAECLYLMIDKHIKLAGDDGDEVNAGAGQSDDSDNESDNDISELIFVPGDKNALAQMYEAIKECQELHPDPADVSTDEDEAFEDMMEDMEEQQVDADIEQNMQMQNLTLNEDRVNGFRANHNHNHMEDEEQEQFEDAD